MIAACPLCDRPTDESRRCWACGTAACGNVRGGSVCGASTGSASAQCCDACCQRAKGGEPGPGKPGPPPAKKVKPPKGSAVEEGRRLIDEHRPGLFGGS